MSADRPFRIRRAAPADAEAICAVHVASIRGLCAGHYTAAQIDAWAGGKRPELYARAMEQGEAMFVAELLPPAAGGAGSATVIGIGTAQGGEVRAVYVHPDHVGRGVGSALLKAVEAHARAEGISVLRLHSTLNARSFYAAYGYQDEGEAVFPLRPGVELPCVKMSKRLAGAG